MTKKQSITYCKNDAIYQFPTALIASVHAFSLPCDRPLRNVGAVSYVYSCETLNRPVGQRDESARPGRRQEVSVNHSIYSADRATHMKIVVVALVAGIAVAGLGISARWTTANGDTQTARVIKAGTPVTITSSDTPIIR
jgi:hypothetical protein